METNTGDSILLEYQRASPCLSLSKCLSSATRPFKSPETFLFLLELAKKNVGVAIDIVLYDGSRAVVGRVLANLPGKCLDDTSLTSLCMQRYYS